MSSKDQILFDMPYEDRYVAANQLLGIHPYNFALAQGGIVNGNYRSSF